MENIVCIENMYKSFKYVEVFRNFNLEVLKNSFTMRKNRIPFSKFCSSRQ